MQRTHVKEIFQTANGLDIINNLDILLNNIFRKFTISTAICLTIGIEFLQSLIFKFNFHS